LRTTQSGQEKSLENLNRLSRSKEWVEKAIPTPLPEERDKRKARPGNVPNHTEVREGTGAGERGPE